MPQQILGATTVIRGTADTGVHVQIETHGEQAETGAL